MHPVLFRIGHVVIDTYTVVWTLSLALSLAWTRSRSSRLYGLDDEDARRALFWGFLGILAGARLGNILMEWPTYAANPGKLLRPWEGGLSALPAVIGGGLAALAVLHRRKIPVWRLAEAASLPAAALVAAGRWGCFFNGCCYGKVSTASWAIRFPFDPIGVTRHATELYESFSALLLFAFLWLIERKIGTGRRKRQASILWPLFLAGYGGIRLVVDRFRGDVDLGTPRALAWSLGVFLLGAVWFSVSAFRPPKPEEEEGKDR
ncbi:MAG: prolipoprotein diacylglyceryl transferase [Synergistales bacterium]